MSYVISGPPESPIHEEKWIVKSISSSINKFMCSLTLARVFTTSIQQSGAKHSWRYGSSTSVGTSTYLLVHNRNFSTVQDAIWFRRLCRSPATYQCHGSILHSLLRTNQSNWLRNLAKSNTLIQLQQSIVPINGWTVEVFMSQVALHSIDNTAPGFFRTTNTNAVASWSSVRFKFFLHSLEYCYAKWHLKLTYVTQWAAVNSHLSEIIDAPHLWKPLNWSDACHGTWVISTRNPPTIRPSGMGFFSKPVRAPGRMKKQNRFNLNIQKRKRMSKIYLKRAQHSAKAHKKLWTFFKKIILFKFRKMELNLTALLDLTSFRQWMCFHWLSARIYIQNRLAEFVCDLCVIVWQTQNSVEKQEKSHLVQ